MRILHIAPRYSPAIGGAETHIAELSQRLVRDGHDVTVATTVAVGLDAFWSGNGRVLSPGSEMCDGVHVRRFPIQHFPSPSLAFPVARRLLWGLSRLHAPLDLLNRLAPYAPWTPALQQWLTTTADPFDLVAAFSVVFEALCQPGLAFARRRGIPFMLTPFTHLGAGRRPGGDGPSRFYTMRHQTDLVRRSTKVIAMTPTEQDYYVGAGVDAARIHVVGSGVTPEKILGGDGDAFRARFGLDHAIVAFLNALAYDKGAMTTVAALERLWLTGEQVHLVMAGSMMAPFDQFLQRLPPSTRSRILVLGNVDDVTKRDLLAACTMLVTPSRVDSFGIAFLEAWLYRKPVIGSTAWGMADVVSAGADGLLTPFGDADALAAAIARLLHDPDLATHFGAAGEAKVYAQHTWERKYAMLAELYGAKGAG